MKKRVADIIFETLASNGINECFGVVGGGAMHLNNALALNKNIRKTFNHHEQASAMAAEAYARYSGKPAIVCVTSGPGATNTLTGVLGAWVDGLPMIVISGNIRYGISKESTNLPLRYRGIQEFDIVNSIQNMTKYAIVLKDPNRVKYEVEKAITISMNGRRGPVWIDVPLDIQNKMVDENELCQIKYHTVLPAPTEYDMLRIQTFLSNAKRPCIIAGSAIVSSHCQDDFEKFANATNIPIVGSAWIADVFYNTHNNFYGLSGNLGPRTGNFILQNSDLIITLGSSLSFNQTGYNSEQFAPNAKIIMIDIDQNEAVKLNNKVDYFVYSDLKLFLQQYQKYNVSWSKNVEWIKYCENLKELFDPFEAVQNIRMDERVSKYYFWKQFDELAPKDTVLALGNSSSNSAKLQVGKKYKRQRIITNYLCGSMGYDLPAALGTAIASNKEVLCITGDGSIMMNLQEIQTIKHYKLPVKIIVFENEGYGAIKQTCKNFFNGKEIGCSPDSGVSFPDFSKIAELFDYKYRCCETNEDVADSLKWLFDFKGYAFLEIKEKLDDPMIPKIMSRINEKGEMLSPALHDMYPFIDDKLMDKLMITDQE